MANRIIKYLIFLLFIFITPFYLNSQDTLPHNIQNENSPIIKDKYEWLVFVFINGVNDLGMDNSSINDINEMENIGSTDKVAVVVEHNKIGMNQDETLTFQNTANTYFILKDKENNPEIISKIIRETPDTDMGNYRHFAISAKYAINRFNPDKILLIILVICYFCLEFL